MVHVVFFHSVLGLRSAELLGAERLRRAGHDVATPDLFVGATASSIDAGFGLLDEIGWGTVVRRARRALADLPEDTALLGVSMGTGVVSDVWAERPATAAVVLLHAAAEIPGGARAGLRVQLHAAEPDEFAPAGQVAALRRAAGDIGVDLEVFRYPGAGHFYTDRELGDHDPAAAELTWRRALRFLGEIEGEAGSEGG